MKRMNFGTTLHTILLCAFVCCGIYALPERASALFMKPVNPLELVVSPQFPLPESTITVTLTSYGTYTKDATVLWFIDGKQDVTLDDLRSVTIPSGDGTRTISVEARITSPSIGTKTMSRTITPGSVDIIAEPDTSVPFVFVGKPLPAAASPVRLVALPQLYTKSGLIPKKDLLFTWKLNGETLLGGSQRGTDTTTITMPRYGTADVTVLIETADGSRSAQNSIVLTPAKPRMLFYETNSLFGTLPYSPQRFTSTKDELTVRATPYYVNKNLITGNTLEYVWRVNGRELTQEVGNSLLTLERKNGGRQSVDVNYASLGTTIFIGQGRFSADFIEESLITL